MTDLLAAIPTALAAVFSLQYILFMLLGVALGLCLGVIPGVGGVVGMSILLPILIGMDPFVGLALLVGMNAVTATSDTFPAVLLGVPGSTGSQATVMDGYPLARQGKAADALGAAFIASMAGGIISAIIFLISIFTIKPLLLLMGTPELFMLSLLGLSMVGILARGAPIAGLAAGLLGLALGAIGLAPATSVYRFNFDTFYLMDGLPIIVVGLGLYALPELLDLLREDKQIAREGRKLEGSRLAGARAALRSKFLIFRSAAIGNAVGVIPGLGGSVVDWLTYGIAQQTLKNTENFGNGDIRGVIAPESANNAKEAGALLPTLMFAIPGTPSTAIMLAGLMLLGVVPGRDMVTTQLPLTLSIVWTLALANLVAAAACFALSKQIARICYIPARKLIPFLIVLLTMSAYQGTNHFGDILMFLGIGVVAWAMKQLSWPRAPVLVGFVLSQGVERYLFRSIARYEYEWLMRPQVMVIGALILLLVFYGFRKQVKKDVVAEEVG